MMAVIGEAQNQRFSVSLPPLAAVASGTRANDYFEILRAPADQTVRIGRLRHVGNATHAAAATNYVDIQAVAILGTTVRTLGSLITTNTAGGWTAQVENDLIVDRNNARLRQGERLAIRFANNGTGVATAGMSFHAFIEIGK